MRFSLPALAGLVATTITAIPVVHAQSQQSHAALEEVVVTARRREESLQETPVAVSAMGEQALTDAGVSTITDLQQTVPGLQFGESGSKTPAIFIRGIGQREGSAVLDPGVGVYLNSIFIARQDGQLLDTVDTQSIQVLRGPQGTLFGKNNTGGAMLVTTKQPHFEQFEWAFASKAGNEGRKDLKISGNIPLVEDRLGMRFALNSKKRTGYLDNQTAGDGTIFGDEERLAATGRFLWDISDSISADLFLYWSKQDEQSTALTCVHQNPESNITQLTWPGTRAGFQSRCNASEALDHGDVLVNGEDSLITMTSTIYALTLNWGFEGFDLKSITGISQQFDIVRNDDQDGTDISAVNNGGKALNQVLATDGKQELDEQRLQISQEIQLSGTAFDDRLNYTAGIFLSLEEIEENPFAQFIGPKALTGIKADTVCSGAAAQAGGFLAPFCIAASGDSVFPLVTVLGTSSTLTNESWAVFAQGTYDLNEWLQLTIGGRHTVEKRERDLTTYAVDHTQYQPRLQAATTSGTFYIEEAGFYSPITAEQLHSAADNNRIPDIPLIVNESRDVREERWRRFTPTVTLSALASEAVLDQFKLDSAMTYLTWSKGFKAGGFEPKGPELTPFDPEDVVNIELGLKLDALESRVRFNAALYSMDYTNIHVRVAEQGARISDIFLFISNAGEATINGIELETTFLLGNWLLFTSANYTDASYDVFDAQVVQIGTGNTFIVDRSDEPFALVPDKSFAFSAMYNWMTPVGMIIPRIAMYYRSEIFTGIDEKAIEYDSSTVGSLTMWNGRLTWLPAENIRVTAFVNNLFDKEYFKSGFAVSAALGAATLVQGEGRSYGLEFAWDFF